jgi:[acyl-carrier-protein] S-malonyltransferase
MAGHSLGEYSALVCGKALEFEDAVKLVADRGKFMQEAVSHEEGAMAAIVGLDEKTVIEICKEAAQNQVVECANYNALGQTVISGHASAVKRAVALALKKNAKLAKILSVSVPAHCELMKPAAVKLNEALARITIRIPEIPVIQNYDVKVHNDPEEIRSALIKQLDNPVHWVKTVELLVKHDIRHAIECGPGKVLTGLNKRITDQMKTVTISTPELLEEALKEVASMVESKGG